MPKKPEDFLVGSDLSLHLVFNLGMHKSKFLHRFMRWHISMDPYVLDSGLLNFPDPNQLTRRIWHECSETYE
jgi:hypothetical protein